MINTQLKFKGKIPMVRICCIHKESHKIFKFQSQLYLKVKVKVTSFQTLETFRCMINSLSWKVKFETVQCLKVKKKFWKFEGQFALEDQGQGHQFSISCDIFT